MSVLFDTQYDCFHTKWGSFNWEYLKVLIRIRVAERTCNIQCSSAKKSHLKGFQKKKRLVGKKLYLVFFFRVWKQSSFVSKSTWILSLFPQLLFDFCRHEMLHILSMNHCSRCYKLSPFSNTYIYKYLQLFLSKEPCLVWKHSYFALTGSVTSNH